MEVCLQTECSAKALEMIEAENAELKKKMSTSIK